MTPEQQRIAIAEACGLKPQHVPLIPNKADFNGWFTTEGAQRLREAYPRGKTVRVIPDYLNDLNAMHEAEKMLKVGDEWHRYYMHFVDAGGTKINATAAQRAEAFLRTIGKWTE